MCKVFGGLELDRTICITHSWLKFGSTGLFAGLLLHSRRTRPLFKSIYCANPYFGLNRHDAVPGEVSLSNAKHECGGGTVMPTLEPTGAGVGLKVGSTGLLLVQLTQTGLMVDLVRA